MLALDEETAIQAFDRRDPVLPLSPRRAERYGFELGVFVGAPAGNRSTVSGYQALASFFSQVTLTLFNVQRPMVRLGLVRGPVKW